MKKKIIYLGMFLFLFNACEKDNNSPMENDDPSQEQVLTNRSDINKLLLDLDDGRKIDWRKMSDDQLWEAYKFANNTTIIGWNESITGTAEKEEILNFVRASEGTTKDKDFIIEDLDGLNTLVLKVTKKETLIGLKDMTKIADLFEIAYESLVEDDIDLALKEEVASKATKNTINHISNTTLHGTEITYRKRFDYHGIKSAWKKGLSGNNIGIAIIDGGVLENDNIYGTNYRNNINGINPPNLRGREIEYNWHGFFTYCTICPWNTYDGPFDTNAFPKGHGTNMIKVATAPMNKNNNHKESTGVAYAADITSIRSSFTVWIGAFSSTLATTKAFNYLADRNDIKIISMSLGRFYSSEMLARSVKKCHNKGKLIFNAAGTVVQNEFVTDAFLFALFQKDRTKTLFPARLDETIACTGVIRNGTDWCDSCHGEADFTTEYSEQDEERSSSYSTATTAGIAALIWEDNPNKSAQQILNIMKGLGEFKNKGDWKGYGRIDLNKYKSTNTNPTPLKKMVHFKKYNHSNYALDGQGGGTDGQNIHLWSSNLNNVNQQWEEIDRGNGFYSYKKYGTNKCIDGSNGGSSGNNVKIWECSATNYNQHWKKAPTNGGRSFMFLKRNALNYAIDGRTIPYNGKNVVMWRASTSNSNQQWILTNLEQ